MDKKNREKLWKSSLIAGLKLFGYAPAYEENRDHVKKYTKKWNIDLSKYPQKCRSGLLWYCDEEFEVQCEKISERLNEELENAGEIWGETGDFEYIFDPETNDGITDKDLFDPCLEKFKKDGKLFSYAGEADKIFITTMDIKNRKEFKQKED